MSAALGSVFEVGYEGMREENDRIQRAIKNRGKEMIGRLYVKRDPTVSRSVLMLQDKPVVLTEHQVKIDGDWRNWFPCLQRHDERGCPLCDPVIENRAYKAGLFAGVELCSYTRRDNTVVRNPRTIITAKTERSMFFDKKNTDKGGLRGTEWKVSRLSEKAPSIGDDWEFQRKWTEEEILRELGEEKAKPFDWASYLKLPTYDELDRIANSIRRAKNVNEKRSDESVPAATSDSEEVPF